MHNLASTYSNEGRWEEAGKLVVWGIETKKTKLVSNHPSTRTRMASLALAEGRHTSIYVGADELYANDMEMCEKAAGLDASRRGESYCNGLSI